MIQRKVILSSIIVMVLSLVSVFSVGIFQSVMSLRDEPEAAYVVAQNLAEYPNGVTIGSDVYNAYDTFIIGPTNRAEANAGEGSYRAQEGFRNFITSVNNGCTFAGKTVKLNYDIDMGTLTSSGVTPYSMLPIGAPDDSNGKFKYNSAITFAGTFDGQGHYIRYLDIRVDSYATGFMGIGGTQEIGIGLFAKLSGEVKNLGLSSVILSDCSVIEPKTYIGNIAGMTYSGASIYNCSINNSYVLLMDTNPSSGGNGSIYVGGIVGGSRGSISIQNCELNNFKVPDAATGSSYGAQIGPAMNIESASGSICYCVVRNCTSMNLVNTGYFSPSNIVTNTSEFANLGDRVSSYGGSSGSSWYYNSDYNDGWPALRTFISGWSTYSFVKGTNPSYGELSSTSSVSLPENFNVDSAISGSLVYLGTGVNGAIQVEGYPVYSDISTTISWSRSGTTFTCNFGVPTCTITFKVASCDSESVYPYSFNSSGTNIGGSGTSDLVVSMPIYSTITTSFSNSSDGWVQVYEYTSNGQTCYIRYRFNSYIPTLSLTDADISSPLSVTSNQTILPKFDNGLRIVTFTPVNNSTMYNVDNNTASSVDIVFNGLVKGIEVTASFNDEFTEITYIVAGDSAKSVKYVCDSGYWISATGLGNTSNPLDDSKTISADTTIKPTIKSSSDTRDLTFNSVTVSDGVGNALTYYPTYTKNGTSMGELTSAISLRTKAYIACTEITNGYRFTVTETDDSFKYVVTYTEISSLYGFTGYEYSKGIKEEKILLIPTGKYYVSATASVTVTADYANLTTINFNVADNAYLYTPVSTPVYDANNYADASFGTDYMNSTNADFANFLKYKSSTYTVKIATDSATSSKPKLIREISKTNDKYTITYIASYKFSSKSKQVEVAQYLVTNPNMEFIEDGYTENTTISSSVTIKPTFDAVIVTFDLPSDTTIARLLINDTIQIEPQDYIWGNNLAIEMNWPYTSGIATYTEYVDIDVDISNKEIVCTINVLTTTKSFSSNSVTTTNSEGVEIITYKIGDDYQSSAYILPNYSDPTISKTATNIIISGDLTISPIVRTDCKVIISISDDTIIPVLYKNDSVLDSVEGFIEIDADNNIIFTIAYSQNATIKFDKSVNLDEGKNTYMFTLNIGEDTYGVIFNIVDYPNYTVRNDTLGYGESKTIIGDLNINSNLILKSYEIIS